MACATKVLLRTKPSTICSTFCTVPGSRTNTILLQTLWTITLRLLPTQRWQVRTPHIGNRADARFKEAISGAHSPQSSSD